MTAYYELHHGDMFDVMPNIAPGSVAMVFADLPYRSTKFHSTECHWDKIINLTAFWNHLEPCAVANAAFVFTAAQPFTTDLINSRRKSFRYTLVWDKVRPGNFVRAKFAPIRFHEDLVVFADTQPTYNPQMVLLKKPCTRRRGNQADIPSVGVRRNELVWDATYTHKHPRSILVFNSREVHNRSLHPTQKPVALLEWLIATYTNPGDLVLDPCFGSNSTGVACARLSRRYIGIEKDPEYFRIGKERLEAEHERMRTSPAQGRLAV